MLNIVIPMAGAGSRFAKEGYKDPKPLIPINSVPMIKVVIDNLKTKGDCHFIFICQKKHVEAYALKEKLKGWAPGCDIVEVDVITEGAACTVLLAESIINNEHPLMIANSDQFIDTDINAYLEFMELKKLDGLIMTMTANDPKWSFIQIGENEIVSQVVEKKVISNEATVGIYNFKQGKDFVNAAYKMIDLNDRTNNEFYVAPVYNYLIRDGYRTGYFNIGSEANGMFGLGTPEDLNIFLNNPISNHI
jgi:dTDP-glucose pyrophosphorylase